MLTTDGIFLQLSFIIVVGALVSIVMRVLRQPLILGYILTGLLVGPAALNLIHLNTFNAFASIGIALLLFIIGLGINISVIKKLGSTIFFAAATELIGITAVGFMISGWLGFNVLESLIIGLCLFFSSTIIIVKILTDKKEQSRLHGQIAIGIVLLDDIVATLALLFVTAAKDHSLSLNHLGSVLLEGVLLLAFLVIMGMFFLPRLVRFMASSQEMLFLFAVGWGFGVASLFYIAGFSIEVGALFAGVALAGLPYAQEIEARLKPLRDFFVVLFFIVLGQSLSLSDLSSALLPAIALSAVVVILKPVIITSTLGWIGYSKRVSFMAGINLSQISEFSIVLAVVALASGLITQEVASIVTLVAIMTIAVSSYLTHYDSRLFKLFDRLPLKLFNRSDRRVEKRPHLNYELILFGYQRGGHEFIKTFQNLHHRFVVVDYDPVIIDMLKQRHIPCLYGDATDTELLDEIGVSSAKLIISTISDFETNQQLVRHVNLFNPDTVIVCNANSYDEALQLYELGSSYVLIPHHASSEYLSGLIERNGIDRRHFDRYRNRHLRQLEQEHPLSAAEDAA